MAHYPMLRGNAIVSILLPQGYESTEASTVLGLPFLAAVIVALFGTVAYVVSQTGGMAPPPTS